MGRGKLSMELITSEKSRKTTFHKRKQCLMRKAYELSTLCDVRTCVFIYGPSQNDQSTDEVHTWPTSRDEIDNIIGAYKTNGLLKRSRKCFDLHDFFSDRKKKIEAEMSKLRKDAAETRHSEWDERLEGLLEDQLRLLMDDLDSKIDAAKRRIDLMEGDLDHGHHYIIGEGTSTMAGRFHSESSSQTLNTKFEQEFFEEQTPIFGNSTIETQWPFHYQMQTEEAPHIPTMIQNHLMGNSFPIMPIDHGIDLSNFFFGSNGAQVQYNYGNLQALIYDDPTNGIMEMESNSMAPNHQNYSIFHNAMPTQSVLPLSYIQYTDQMPFPSNSQMMLNASSQVFDQFDYLDYEYLMKTLNY